MSSLLRWVFHRSENISAAMTELVLLQLKLAVLKYRHYKLNKIAKNTNIFEQLESLKSQWVSYWH